MVVDTDAKNLRLAANRKAKEINSYQICLKTTNKNKLSTIRFLLIQQRTKIKQLSINYQKTKKINDDDEDRYFQYWKFVNKRDYQVFDKSTEESD